MSLLTLLSGGAMLSPPPPSTIGARGAYIQGKVWFGYAKAATVLGQAFNQFRPSGPTNPTSGTPLQILPVQFTNAKAAAFNFVKAFDFDSALAYALIDATQIQVGDYIVSPTLGTYFIAAFQPLLPILCVKCIRTINLLRPQAQNNLSGLGTYGGETKASNVPVLTGWPSWYSRGKGAIRGHTEGNLPVDTSEKNYEFILPAFTADIYQSDTITDDLGLTYIINQIENTPLGYRISAQQAVT